MTRTEERRALANAMHLYRTGYALAKQANNLRAASFNRKWAPRGELRISERRAYRVTVHTWHLQCLGRLPARAQARL